MKYMTCKVFKEVPKNEEEYLNMRDTIPAVLKALHEMNEYRLTYLAEDNVEAGEVWVAPYGKRTCIVVTEEVTTEISEDITYRPLTRKIDTI